MITKPFLPVILLFAILHLVGRLANAQAIAPGSTISAQTVYGSHLIAGDDAVKDRMYGVDVTWLKDLHTKTDEWVQRSGAKAYGMTFMYRNLNRFNGYGDTSANSFGQSYGLAGTMQFRVLKIKKASLLLSPAIGVSYITKSFFTHPYNRFIGSHLNLSLKSDIGIELPVSSSVRILAGVGFMHHSNAGFKLPNGGINMGSAYAGLRIGSIAENSKPKADSYRPLTRNSWEFAFGLGRRGIYEKHTGNYRSGLYAGYNYRLNDLINLKGGVDAVYYFTQFDVSNFWETYQNNGTSYDPWRVGISAGADLNLWRVVITGQAGKYVHFDRYVKNITWYWTFGPTYFITQHVGIQARCHMNLDQADFLNYGFVFRL